jgi:hypothetical protein
MMRLCGLLYSHDKKTGLDWIVGSGRDTQTIKGNVVKGWITSRISDSRWTVYQDLILHGACTMVFLIQGRDGTGHKEICALDSRPDPRDHWGSRVLNR